MCIQVFITVTTNNEVVPYIVDRAIYLDVRYDRTR